jgi:hypothetical protein
MRRLHEAKVIVLIRGGLARASAREVEKSIEKQLMR